jgi:hypothetical protein
MILESMIMASLIETPIAGIVKEILGVEGHTPVSVGLVEDSPPFSYTGDITECTYGCGWVSSRRKKACLRIWLLTKGVLYEPAPHRSSTL